MNDCIGAAAVIAPIGIAAVHQPTVKEDGVAGIKLNGDLFGDVHFVIMENVPLDWMIMMGQVYRVGCRDDVNTAVFDDRRIDGEPEVHGVQL